jgi:hypothetical protein
MKFNDLEEIAIAWFRSRNPTAEQQQLALERLAVCDTCEFKQNSILFDGYKCSACGCPLHKKIFSTAGSSGVCPKGKWSR